MGVPQETYAYAKTLLDVATSSADGRTRALLVGGGIANFTDVAATFKGIIQVRPPRQPLFSMLWGLKNLGSFFFAVLLSQIFLRYNIRLSRSCCRCLSENRETSSRTMKFLRNLRSLKMKFLMLAPPTLGACCSNHAICTVRTG